MTEPTKWHVRPAETDQPGHLPSMIRVFTVRMKKAWDLSYPLSTQRRLGSDWADAQADLSLHWAHTHFVGFVWSESSLSAWRKLGSLATHWAHSEDADQTRQMPRLRLIWVFTGHTLILLVLSCRGSYIVKHFFFLFQIIVKFNYFTLKVLAKGQVQNIWYIHKLPQWYKKYVVHLYTLRLFLKIFVLFLYKEKFSKKKSCLPIDPKKIETLSDIRCLFIFCLMLITEPYGTESFQVKSKVKYLLHPVVFQSVWEWCWYVYISCG